MKSVVPADESSAETDFHISEELHFADQVDEEVETDLPPYLSRNPAELPQQLPILLDEGYQGWYGNDCCKFFDNQFLNIQSSCFCITDL